MSKMFTYCVAVKICMYDSDLPVWIASCTANRANRHLLVCRGQFLHVAPSN